MRSLANVKFFSGQESNLDNLAKKAGQVLLALNSNEGSLYYDIDSNTRIKLNAKNADTANRLATSRTILTNLGSTSSASFNGTANITPGITGTLSVAHGGTGATSAADARNNLGAAASNHTHNAATTSANGFMSASDKTKLDGIAAGANKYTHPTYTTKSSGLYKITVDSLGHISAATAVTKSDITALGIPGQDTNTTYSAFKGASTSAAGGSGLVPAPAQGASNRYLRSDGTWQVPPDTNTTYGVATTSANGLMSASDKVKLNGIATGANKYTHPSYTARSSGLYKITVDASGHVSAVTAVTKADITALGIPGQDTNTVYTHPTSSGNKHIPSGGSSGQILRWSADGTAVWGPDNNTTYNVATTSTNGLMSAADKSKLNGIASGANKYSHPTSSGNKHIPAGGSSGQILRWSADGTAVWGSDNNTTYSTFKAASSSAAGGSGLVPAPTAGAANRYLRSDGTWSVPPDTNTTYGAATTSSAGLMSASDKSKLNSIASGANKTVVDASLSSTSTNPVQNKVINSALAGKASSGHGHSNATTSTDGFMASEDKSKLNGIASGANKYTHPSYTSRSSGLYKVTVDSSGHVSAATAVTKSDITALGIPSTNTTYSVATTSANGLMSASDKTKLNGIATNANNYVHPTSAGNKHIPFGGSSGQILRWSADGTAEWGNAGSIIYSDVEEETGNTWLDGRPIYGETVLFSAPTKANATTTVTFNFANIHTAWIDSSSTFFIARDSTTTISHPGYMADTGARLFMAQLRPERDQLLVVTNMAGTAYIRVCYTKISDDPTYYHLPFLHSSNEQNCVITSSSIFSNLYTREYAFNGLTANYWACAVSDTQRWIQVQMPYALRKMMVTLVSPQGRAVTNANVPKSVSFQGSNNGSTWKSLGSSNLHDATPGSTTSIYIANSTGYKYLRIKVTDPDSGPWTGFGDIRIKGEVVS